MTTLMTLEHEEEPGVSPVVAPNYQRRWWILGVLGIAQLMVVLDSTIVNIALPTAQRDLHFSPRIGNGSLLRTLLHSEVCSFSAGASGTW